MASPPDTTMRPKNGDLFVDLRNGEGSVKWLVVKEDITPKQRAVVNAMMHQLADLLKQKDGANG